MIERLRKRYAVPHEPLRSERRVELAVLVLALFVVLQLLILLGRYVATGQVRAVPPAPDSLSLVSRRQVVTPTPQQSLEVLARPVFFASRRPADPLAEGLAAETEEGSAKKAGTLQGLKVLGILENGDRSRVIVSFRGEQQRLLKGESIDGWQLIDVSPGRVVLESGDRRDERRLSPMPVVAAAPAGQTAGDQTRKATATTPAAAERSAAGGADGASRPRQQQENVRRTLSVGGAPIQGQSGN